MVIFPLVLPFLDPKHSMASTIFMLSFTLPKTIQQLSLSTDEKLADHGSSICHGRAQDQCDSGWNSEGLTSRAIMKWSHHLAHKTQNNSVKTKFFLPGAHNMKVFCCLWKFICKQLEGDTAQELAVDATSKNVVGLAVAGWHRQLRSDGFCKAGRILEYLGNFQDHPTTSGSGMQTPHETRSLLLIFFSMLSTSLNMIAKACHKLLPPFWANVRFYFSPRYTEFTNTL